MPDLQSHTKKKTISFAEKRWVNVQQSSKWLTTWHVTVYAHYHQRLCIFPSECIGREDSVQLPSGDIVVHGKVINCIPRGNNSSRLTSDKGREKTTHPRKDCAPRQRGSSRYHPRYHADMQCKPCSLGEQKWKTFLKCQGHMTFWVPEAWALVIVKPWPQWLDSVRSD